MKFRWILVAVIFSLVVAPLAAHAEGLKIGYIVKERLLVESKAGKQARDKLGKRLEEEQRRLDKKAAELGELQEDIRRRMAVLNEEERRKVMEEHEREARAAKRMQEDSQRELDKAEAEILGEVGVYLNGVIQKYAKDNGYDMILDASTLLYISEKADVTTEVIKVADKSR